MRWLVVVLLIASLQELGLAHPRHIRPKPPKPADDDDDDDFSDLDDDDDATTPGPVHNISDSEAESAEEEGLDPVQVQAASFVEQRDGEEHHRVTLPPNPDETAAEENIIEAQESMEKLGVHDAALLNGLAKAIDKTNLTGEEVLSVETKHGVRLKQMAAHKTRAAFNPTATLWEKGIVPYEIGKSVGKSAVPALNAAIGYINYHSCVRLIPHTPSVFKDYGLSHQSYLKFIKAKGCWSAVGRASNGKQDISACSQFGMGTPQHEILHALGSLHEQARSDRDRYVQIAFVNVKDGMKHNFDKHKSDNAMPYDYGSVMHYSSMGFSMNGEKTLNTYNQRLEFLAGSRKHLSFYDLKALTHKYRCQENFCESFPSDCANEGFVGVVNGACQCICPLGLGGNKCSEVIKPCAKRSTSHVVLSESKAVHVITSPGYPKTYGNKMECVWLVESPPKTFIKIKFDDLDMEFQNGTCFDSLEVRSSLLGQAGERFCGNFFKGSRVTSNNAALLIMRTDESTGRGGFRLKVSYLSEAKSVYDLRDKGASYRGNVGFTQNYAKCVRWDQATECTINPVKTPNAGLGNHNFCRNPNHAPRPWCYVNAAKCDVDLCDVSLLNGCKDIRPDCAEKKGSSFCCTDAGFTNCHKTCGYCDPDANVCGKGGKMPKSKPIVADKKECLRSPQGRSYKGTMSRTETGQKCQRWDATEPHDPYDDAKNPDNFPDNTIEEAANYCRNPDGEQKPWCFTTDPAVMWSYCNIPLC